MLNSIPHSLKKTITEELTLKFGKKTDLLTFNFSTGGCINKTGVLETSNGNFFIKWNSRSQYPDMFEKEFKGLELLRTAEHSLKIPKPIKAISNEDFVLLILENIVSESKTSNFWENLGYGLAELHRNANENYGLNYDNYIGSIKQRNQVKDDWLEFFIENRIEYTFKLASDSGFFDSTDRLRLNKLLTHLTKICPENIKPSLIHGDLWSGNLIVNEIGEPCLIDPAVYFGFREMEIAFTELFGGFNEDFYSAYNQKWQLEKGYNERKDIWNLYPLLVHVNLFGASYASSVKSILKSFSGI